MSDHLYLRMTIDVCVFADDYPQAKRIAKTILKEGRDTWGTGETLAREFMDQVGKGIEIDNIFGVEDHGTWQ